MRTAVWALTCVQPTIRAFFKGLSSRARFLRVIIPGISCSAISISLRPKACWLAKFLTQKSEKPLLLRCFLSRGDVSSSSELAVKQAKSKRWDCLIVIYISISIAINCTWTKWTCWCSWWTPPCSAGQFQCFRLCSLLLKKKSIKIYFL